MSWAKGAKPWQRGLVSWESLHPISLTRVPLVIPHPLTGEKSICTTESFSTSHQENLLQRRQFGDSHCGKGARGKAHCRWRNWRIWRRDWIKPHTTFWASRTETSLQPWPLWLDPGIYSCREPGSLRETTKGGHRNCINLEVDRSFSICCLSCPTFSAQFTRYPYGDSLYCDLTPFAGSIA